MNAPTEPTRLSDQEYRLACVFRARRPVRGDTSPLVACEWYDMLRAVANELFPNVGEAHRMRWQDFMSTAGYFG